MNSFKLPSHQAVEKLREQYPPGTRISLLKMDDPYSKLQPGDRATVEGVDDAGGLMCRWDNGEGLSLDYFEDDYRKLTAEELAEEIEKIQSLNRIENVDTNINAGYFDNF